MNAADVTLQRFSGWLQRWWPVFYGIAIAGFILSLITHLFALANRQPPWGELAWPLHVGIFVVFVPALLHVTALERRDRANQKVVLSRNWLIRFGQNYWRMNRPSFGWPLEIWRRCPLWLGALAAVAFVYSLAFMAICFSCDLLPRGPNAGMPTPPIVFAFFSSGWMCFYGISAAILNAARAATRNMLNAAIR